MVQSSCAAYYMSMLSSLSTSPPVDTVLSPLSVCCTHASKRKAEQLWLCAIVPFVDAIHSHFAFGNHSLRTLMVDAGRILAARCQQVLDSLPTTLEQDVRQLKSDKSLSSAAALALQYRISNKEILHQALHALQ